MESIFDSSDDSFLVTEIRNDNRDAFRALYNRYSRKLYYFALRYTGIREESEECLQSIFINIWERRKILDSELSIKSYIYKSAVNYIKNFLRKKALCARFIESNSVTSHPQTDSTYQEVLYHDLESSLVSALRNLPDQQQKIFKMSRYEGLSNKEIALKLNISIRTVENHIYRVLRILKSMLKEECFILIIPIVTETISIL